MIKNRSLILGVSNLLFIGIAASLWYLNPWAIALFPTFALIFYWTDFCQDEEMHVIFLFLAAATGLILLSVSKEAGARAGLGIELAGLFLTVVGLGLHRSRVAGSRNHTLGLVQEFDGHIRDLERDVRFYNTFDVTATNQIQLRRDLTEVAKSLGTTLDSQEAQRRLLQILGRRYPQSRVGIVPGEPPDALIRWVVDARASVLIKDVQTDERFARSSAHGFRSAMVAPLMVLRRPFGYLRVEDDRPGAFKADDLRTVDLFATLASLTLENVQFFQNVNDLATHDALTQLYTHRAFQTRLQEEVLRAGRSQAPLALIMCDVDHFKRYNDTYGHQAGDQLLRTVAGILSNDARPVDFVARYGGEEFCVIQPGCNRSQGVEFAERLRARVSQEPFTFQGQRTPVTMSFGVASFPEDATTPSQVVRAADERLYKAKTGGRNRVVG